ncbi:UNVERIFIED_CONTAM: hypothetical protein PYX00_009834 [Menopon gallinae]|uniref:CCHC-type domain-containing protein n=1 Tax=Menopon gallinae TaxID=328185 RepID=A0AAW2HD72_9NEOP
MISVSKLLDSQEDLEDLERSDDQLCSRTFLQVFTLVCQRFVYGCSKCRKTGHTKGTCQEIECLFCKRGHSIKECHYKVAWEAHEARRKVRCKGKRLRKIRFLFLYFNIKL